MIELLVGYYIHAADHSMAAKWRPAPSRPAYAETVYQASVVSWRSLSDEAVRQKARHFRKTLANAEGQLPADRPGVIHVGIETYAGADVDFTRHLFNTLEARSFSPKKSRLRWVYANHFVPEATTRKDESWAITETMVPYKIGSHRTRWPLPGHMLVSPEGEGRPGGTLGEEAELFIASNRSPVESTPKLDVECTLANLVVHTCLKRGTIEDCVNAVVDSVACVEPSYCSLMIIRIGVQRC